MIFEISILVILIISSIEDIRKKEVLLWEIIACAMLSLSSAVYGFVSKNPDMAGILLSLIPGGLMLFLAFATRQSIGYGDGLIVLAAGPSLGLYKLLFVMAIAFFASSIFSGLLVAFKRAGKKTRIPFVPFLALGTGLMLFLPAGWG
jgi:leader peptidase (prepilin peptidase)/N-methyltransferase